MNISFNRLNEFMLISDSYLKRNEGKENKLTYALRKIRDSVNAILKVHSEELEDISIELCSVDAKKNLIFDANGNYSFTKEKQAERVKQVRELNEDDRYEFTPWLVSEVPEGLTELERTIFEGIIIKASDPEQNKTQPE